MTLSYFDCLVNNQLTSTEKIVLLHLFYILGEEEKPVSLSKLCIIAGIGRRTSTDIVKKLEYRKLIHLVRQGPKPTIFKLNAEEIIKQKCHI